MVPLNVFSRAVICCGQNKSGLAVIKKKTYSEERNREMGRVGVGRS